MAASLNDDDLEILAEKLLAKMLVRLAQRAQAENDPAPVDGAAATRRAEPVPKFKKRTVASRAVRPTPADEEFAARWTRQRARKE